VSAKDKEPAKAKAERAADTKKKAVDYRIPSSSGWAGAWKKLAIVGVVGLAASAYGWSAEPERFAFSYLFAFFAVLTVALGSLFFVMIQYITKAGWSVSVRRIAEFFMVGLPVFVVLVAPIVLSAERLFPWWHPHAEEHAAEVKVDPREAARTPEVIAQPGAFGNSDDMGSKEPAALAQAYREKKMLEQLQAAKELEEKEVLKGKSPYLNQRFFFFRAAFYVLVWFWLSIKYFRWSTDQDKTKKADNTAAGQKFAPIGLILFAVTITFAAFDWVMSLDPVWFSTIFGVTIFASGILSFMGTLILTSMLMQRGGLLKDAINVEHYHDMGKLLFGWLVFWAYVNFAQFFLIWYANIPEEVRFFHHRWSDQNGTWKPVSMAIMIFQFAVPFWLLMSRNVKRFRPGLALGSTILVAMHVVNMYWLVMPNLGEFKPHWLDVTCLLGVAGVYLAVVLRAMENYSLIPVGDPRLVRALKFENA
jgi:hypothetical protein